MARKKYYKIKKELYDNSFFCGRDEWTRTTDPHLIRKSLFEVWVEHLLPFAPYLQ